MFCLKEKNAKKLNSHRWALEAFAPTLQPNIVSVLPISFLTLLTSIIRVQYSHRRRNETRTEISLSSLEDLRSQLQRRWCLWGDHRDEGEMGSQPVSCRAGLRNQQSTDYRDSDCQVESTRCCSKFRKSCRVHLSVVLAHSCRR